MKTVFLDMDGTLNSYCNDQDKVNMTEFPAGTFLHRQPVYQVIDAIIDNFQHEHLAILSAVPHDLAIEEKNIWLDKHFPISERHFVKWREETKDHFIKEYANRHDIKLCDIILIDDDHKILSEVEHLGCQVFHPSRVLSLWQDRGKENERE